MPISIKAKSNDKTSSSENASIFGHDETAPGPPKDDMFPYPKYRTSITSLLHVQMVYREAPKAGNRRGSNKCDTTNEIANEMTDVTVQDF